MGDLDALANLVRTLREAGALTYEGPVPGGGAGLVKLSIRPLAPAPPQREERRPPERKQERPPVPAGLGYGVV